MHITQLCLYAYTNQMINLCGEENKVFLYQGELMFIGIHVYISLILDRYTFVVPPATAPMIAMHTSHTPPSLMNQERRLQETLSTELKPKTWCLHPIENQFRMDFPELRLIQYDCGKISLLAAYIYLCS